MAKDKNELSEVFGSNIKALGGRLTKERLLLLKIICNMKGHFEAEDIHQELKKQGHKISLATIYRNLSLIVKSGIIRKVSFSQNQSLASKSSISRKFECIWGQEHHDHLICINCGKKVDFTYSAIEILQEAVAKEHGYILTGHTLELFGLCPKCK